MAIFLFYLPHVRFLSAQPYPRLNSDHAFRVFKQVKAQRAAGAKELIAIFDLDDTLVDTRPRSVEILRDCYFSKLDDMQKNAFTELVGVKKKHIRYVFSDTLKEIIPPKKQRYGEYPYLLEDLEACWREKFFGDTSYLTYDKAFEGAKEWLNYMESLGVHIVYLSARSHDIQKATLDSLERLGFPNPVEEEHALYLKPMREKRTTHRWKKDVLKSFQEQGYRLVTVFENDPFNVDSLRSLYTPEDGLCYSAPFFFLDTIRENKELYPRLEKEKERPEVQLLSGFWSPESQAFCESYLAFDQLN